MAIFVGFWLTFRGCQGVSTGMPAIRHPFGTPFTPHTPKPASPPASPGPPPGAGLAAKRFSVTAAHAE